MNYILLPSLKQASVVRTASLLYNDEEINSLLYNDEEIKNLPKEEKTTNRRWDSVETKIADKLSPFLPPSLRNSVAKVIGPMNNEVELWKQNHYFLLKHLSACSTWVVWKTDGTIDRTQTAKKIIANDNIDPKVRFVLACTYFLEDEVLALWERIKKVRKKMKELVFEDTNSAVKFWLKRLKKKNTKLWREKIDGFIRRPRWDFSPADIPMRVSCFYPFLSRETRQSYIPYFSKPSVHADDFQVCVNNMDETDRLEAFKAKFPHGLFHCIQWPYRTVFIKLAKEVLGYMTFEGFRTVLFFLLHSYAFDEYEDFHLIEEFWQMSPTAFKEETKKRNELLNFFITWYGEEENYSPHIRAFKEIVRKCHLD